MQRRQLHLLGHGQDDRHQQHQSDFEEQRDADDERGDDHRPLHVLLAELLNERDGDPLGATSVGDQATQHGAEAEDQGDVAERAAEAALDGLHHLVERQAKGQRDAERRR